MENCIKCGSKVEDKDVLDLGSIIENDHLSRWFVRCPQCGFDGPIYINRDDATWAWNYMSTEWRKLHMESTTWKQNFTERNSHGEIPELKKPEDKEGALEGEGEERDA